MSEGGAPARVSIAIVDGYEVVTLGVAAMLEPYADRIRIVELLADAGPSRHVDVALFDVFGSGEVHAGAIARMLDDPRFDRVAVFTANMDPELVRTAEDMGVHGYLSKSLGADELADALVRIAAGEVVIATGHAGRSATPRRWPGMLHDLTETDAQVLSLITQGYDNETIAERLYISPNTLKTRIRKLYRRLGFENRVQAAVWGLKHGFEAEHVAMLAGATAEPAVPMDRSEPAD